MDMFITEYGTAAAATDDDICRWPEFVNWCCTEEDSASKSGIGDENAYLGYCTKSDKCSDVSCILSQPCIVTTYLSCPVALMFMLLLLVSFLTISPYRYNLLLKQRVLYYFTFCICFAASILNLAFFVTSVTQKSARIVALYFAFLSLTYILITVKIYQTKLQIRSFLHFGHDLLHLIVFTLLVTIQILITAWFPAYNFVSLLTSSVIHGFVLLTLMASFTYQIYCAIARKGFTRLDEDTYITDGSDLGPAENRVGFFTYLTIGWVTPLMNRGWYGTLTSVDDCYFLPESIDIKKCADQLEDRLKRELESCRETLEADLENNYESIIDDEKSENSGDIEKIVIVDSSNRKRSSLWNCVNKDKRPAKFSIYKVFWEVYGWKIVPMLFLRIASDSCNLASPVFLNLFISYLSDEDVSLTTGVLVGLTMISLTLLGTVFDQMYFYQSWKVAFRVRGAFMITIYRKLLQVNQCQLSKFSTGEIVNFMSRDAFNISYIPLYLHQFFAMPLNVAAVLVLLYWQVGISFLAGVALCVLCIPFNQWLSGRILDYDQQYYKHRDKRVKVITELLNGIRTVKLAALESFFTNKVAKIRDMEMFNVRRLKYLDAFCVYIWAALPVLLGVAIFTSYASLGNTVTAATVFTVLCYVNLLIGPLNTFPWILNTLIEAYVSFKRLNLYYAMTAFDRNKFYSGSGDSTPSMYNEDSEHSDASPNRSSSSSCGDAVYIRNALFSYGNKNENAENQVKSIMVQTCLKILCMSHQTEDLENEPNNKGFQKLQNITLSVDHGNFIGVFGKVGSGKTSLLSAIIGEMNKAYGAVRTSQSKQGFGYVPQEAWLQTGTIRDNILLGSAYDAKLYERVLKACALVDDLKSLPQIDLTPVGERGITLSGGQKARVTLARALYKNFDVYLLDDPISAVDAHVASHIYKNCIRGFLRDKTVILCTHHVQYLRECDKVVHLEHGIISTTGPPDLVLPKSVGEIQDDDTLEGAETKRVRADSENLVVGDRANPDYQVDDTLDEDEQRIGDVDSKLYLKYFEASGKFLCIITLVALTLMQASKNLSDWWLTYWTDKIDDEEGGGNSSPNSTASRMNGASTNHGFSFFHINFISVNHENCETYQHSSLPYKVSKDAADDAMHDYKFYLLVYGLIALSNSFFSLFRAFSFAIANIQASIKIHLKLLDSVLKFKSSIFSVTPVGRIVNRFSSDVTVLDDDLPFMFNILLGQGFTAIGLLVVILLTVPYIIPLVFAMLILFYRLQIYYRRTSRELRRIATTNMSPVYHHFNESLYGAPIIKAMRVTELFQEENERRVIRANRSRFNERAVQRWFNIRVQLVSAVILMLAILVGLVQKQFAPSLIESGLLGLCLSYCLTIRSTLTQLLATFAENEKNIISVERIADYSDPVKWERLHGSIKKESLSNWPQKGSIEFRNVTLRYGDDENKEPALRDLSLKIEGGLKVGICGRTGAGKSSILSVLFRLEEICGGSIFIDGVDIGEVDVRFLRSRLSIIPQDPFLFTGTVRENLDQSADGVEKSDEQLWTALERAHMKEAVEKLGGLDAEVGEKGQYFSAGQKQLICLARALLLDTHILCLDEATANVDTETDHNIQQTIREEFNNGTVITIAHRINTILHCDHVIVLNKGSVCEEGSPAELLKVTDGVFAQMVSQSGSSTTTTTNDNTINNNNTNDANHDAN